MQTEFLQSIGYSLNVTEAEYGKWLNVLKQYLSIDNYCGLDQNILNEQVNQIVPALPTKSKLNLTIGSLMSHHQFTLW
jgi:hypothetical protein